jgi:urate oxidase
MSVSGIMSTGFYQPSSIQNSFQQRRAEFQQLGQDLQSGNVTAAQQDYAELTASTSGASSSSTTAATATSSSSSTASSASSLAQEFTALGQALQTGNLSAAQQAYSAMQQDAQSISQTQGHHHHHHHHSGASSNSQTSTDGSSSSTSSTSTTGASSSTDTSSVSSLMSVIGMFSAVA